MGRNRLVKRFVLDDSKAHSTLFCVVKLIKKGDRFEPRFEFAKRKDDDTLQDRIDLDDCHENLWALLGFVESCADVEVPNRPFSLTDEEDAELVRTIKNRGSKSVTEIVKMLALDREVSLSQADINLILDRKGKLAEFSEALALHPDDEGWWQKFFNENKWIFGYGLNYQIIGIEESQPDYGGTRVDRGGAQKGDYLGASKGDVGFTVLVEIKTPNAPLVSGPKPIRSGAWALSQSLTDGISQLQSNVHQWETGGARQPENLDRFEAAQVFTVRPRGILVIGRLSSVADDRSRRETLQRFRMGMHGIEIVTFDELHRRAQFIVAQHEQ